MSSQPERWHKRIAAITGKLSFRIVAQSLRRSELEEWAAELRAIADEMQGMSQSQPNNKKGPG